jgi:hypothetical protein
MAANLSSRRCRDINEAPGRPCLGSRGTKLYEQFLAIEVHGGDLLEARPLAI